MRGIYYYHTQVNGWNDIGYNFLIDRFGTIYEGRYGGVASAVIGAQVLGFNSMSTGVSLIGTFTSVAPSQAALSSLEHLLAWKLDLSHLDPQGTSRVECFATEKYKAGQWVTVPVIAGPSSGELHGVPRQRAVRHAARHPHRRGRSIGDPKIYTPSASPRAFSPNGDGVRDSVAFKAGLSGDDDWTIALSDAAGNEVARFAGTGTSASAVWNGRSAAGARLPDGAYTATFAATSANGTARPASIAIRLDTVAPVISGLTVSPAMISPNGDRSHDTAQISLTASEAGATTLSVRNASGAVVRTVGPTATKAGQVHLAWDGKVSSGSAAGRRGRRLVQRRRQRDRRGRQHGDRDAAPYWSTTPSAMRASRRSGCRPTATAPATPPCCRSTRRAPPRSAYRWPRPAVPSCAASRSAVWQAAHTPGAGTARTPPATLVADGAYVCTLSATNAIGTTVASHGPARGHGGRPSPPGARAP